MKGRYAFTLIELLIVVAIIGILAAIAVPNFLNARMKATIAKMESDMKALGDALMMFRIDNKCYFNNMSANPYAELSPLTTPVSYIAAIPHDPFRVETGARLRYSDNLTPNYDYTAYYDEGGCAIGWLLHGLGPDKDEDTSVGQYTPGTADLFKRVMYNPSNGMVSSGDVVHTSWFGLSF
ncbi:MAG: prepilin-type N-terminal cleavage/methylation domain-containing protein [bacterium]